MTPKEKPKQTPPAGTQPTTVYLPTELHAELRRRVYEREAESISREVVRLVEVGIDTEAAYAPPS